jgi:hypothetical protein
VTWTDQEIGLTNNDERHGQESTRFRAQRRCDRGFRPPVVTERR